MRMLVGVCAAFGTIFLLACISLVIKNNRLQSQLSQRAHSYRSRGNMKRTNFNSKNRKKYSHDDSDDDFFSDLIDNDENLDEEAEATDSIIDEEGSSSEEEDDSTWIKNDLISPEKKPKIDGKSSSVSSDATKIKITVSGAHGPTNYLNTLVLTINKDKPYVTNKMHFNGVATLSSGQEVDLHLSSPANDPFWYITLGDTIHRASDGSNLTPVIAYTKCSNPAIYPWQPGAMCEWTVHEGKDIGWRVSQDLRLRS